MKCLGRGEGGGKEGEEKLRHPFEYFYLQRRSDEARESEKKKEKGRKKRYVYLPEPVRFYLDFRFSNPEAKPRKREKKRRKERLLELWSGTKFLVRWWKRGWGGGAHGIGDDL